MCGEVGDPDLAEYFEILGACDFTSADRKEKKVMKSDGIKNNLHSYKNRNKIKWKCIVKYIMNLMYIRCFEGYIQQYTAETEAFFRPRP